MSGQGQRIVTGHDADGKSIILWNGPAPQNHATTGPGVGADFIETWDSSTLVPALAATVAAEPNEKPLTTHLPVIPAEVWSHPEER